MRTLPLLAAALAATIAVPAAAQETRASASAKLAAEFKASDKDGDGYLSRKEMLARVDAMRTTRGGIDSTHAGRIADLFFARADTNKDGKVSRAESDRLMGAVFNRYDLNGDGKVDRAEAAKARAEARSGKAAR